MSSSAGGGNLNPNPWTPYETYRDCSQGICSIYCPQWCYIMFPPPPPSFNMYDDDDSSSTNFSPLLIALIGVLATAFLLVSYYTLISRFCRRGRDGSASRDAAGRIHSVADAWIPSGGGRNPPAVVGLDEALIKSIAVYKYKKEDGVVNCVDCSVCLSEFEENESLRLLPECTHAFHVPCIDTWLKSHSNCPICRASIAAASTGSNPPVTVGTDSSGINRTTETSVSAMEYQQRSGDSVEVIVHSESDARNEAVVTISIRDGDASTAKPLEREDRVKDTEETSMRMGRRVGDLSPLNS